MAIFLYNLDIFCLDMTWLFRKHSFHSLHPSSHFTKYTYFMLVITDVKYLPLVMG